MKNTREKVLDFSILVVLDFSPRLCCVAEGDKKGDCLSFFKYTANSVFKRFYNYLNCE